MSDLRKFLGGMAKVREMNGRRPAGWRWTSIETLLLEHGREWPWATLLGGIRAGAPKACFRNAFLLAMRRPEFTYVEGYASVDGSSRVDRHRGRPRGGSDLER